MSSELNSKTGQESALAEAITAILLVPIALPVATAVSTPLGKEAIKMAILLVERAKETIAQTQEALEDLTAEVQAELASQPPPRSIAEAAQDKWQLGKLPTAEEVTDGISGFNQQLRQATQGMVDLRLLVPMGLGAIALRQLLLKGWQLEDIPWYVLAWYAFDSFFKLNQESGGAARVKTPGSELEAGNRSNDR